MPAPRPATTRHRLLTATLALTLLVTAGTGAADATPRRGTGSAAAATTNPPASPAPPAPGRSGSSDSLFPAQGNGGYDVGHYGLDIRYTPATDVLAGTAVITEAVFPPAPGRR